MLAFGISKDRRIFIGVHRRLDLVLSVLSHLVARRPVRQPVFAHAILEPLAVHLQHADQEVARVAGIDDVLRLEQPRELPRRGIVLDFRDQLLEALRVVLLLDTVEHVD